MLKMLKHLNFKHEIRQKWQTLLHAHYAINTSRGGGRLITERERERVKLHPAKKSWRTQSCVKNVYTLTLFPKESFSLTYNGSLEKKKNIWARASQLQAWYLNFYDLKVEYLCFCEYNIYCLLGFFFRTLPESPPDSSSEPYSPQQVNGK